ncbi:MAG TPA: histidine phosphatase family protein [Patescibacteria group bacterium]|nr:histidine phosphatase family protein [Patescibacteria group bacterium]
MNLYLVRHTEFNNPKNLFHFRLPMPLSATGRQNAKRIGQWFVKQKLKKLPIYSSPMVRCVQTAKLIGVQTDSSVTVDDRLIEVGCPNLQGKPKAEKQAWKIEQDDPSREPKDRVVARMMSVIKEKVSKGKECVLVSHGEPLTFAYWYLTNQKFPRYPWDPKNKSLIIQRGEVVKLEFQGKTFKKATKIKIKS